MVGENLERRESRCIEGDFGTQVVRGEKVGDVKEDRCSLSK